MKEEKDYIRDIVEIRSIMERSSKFLSLSGWAGILAGIYALAGAYIAYNVFHFNPDAVVYSHFDATTLDTNSVSAILLALVILLLAVGTAIILSAQKANKRKEKLWNATSKRLVANMSIPLIVGGLVILLFISKGFIGLLAPFSLLFYGLALCNASQFTYEEVKSLGIIDIVLGLLSTYYIEYGLLCWAIGFGVFHIIYGIYMHFRYER